MSQTRGFRTRPLPRAAPKKRKVNFSPHSEDEMDTSPTGLDAYVRKIKTSLKELESLRSKSTNLNGKVKGSMASEISNINSCMEVIAKSADTLKNKIESLIEENRKLRGLDGSACATNSYNLGPRASQDFTPRSSQTLNLDMDVEYVANFPAQTQTGTLNDDFTVVRNKNKRRISPLTKSYAEMLRVDLPPETPKARAKESFPGLPPRQITETQRVRTESPPATLKIKGKDIAYEDLVSKIKSAVKPADFDVNVLSLRKNPSQELEIRVRGPEDKIALFKAAIIECIGTDGTTERVQPMAFIHISDLESDIGAEEIATDLGKACDLGAGDIKITSLRPAYGGTQKATAKLSRVAAIALQKLGRVSVGYVTCRVQIRTFETRCFRCGESGHFASSCKGPDKSGQCFRCGSNEHKIQSCPEKGVKSDKNIAN